MRTVKTWKLWLDIDKHPLTEADLEYLRGCCNRVETKRVEFPNLLNYYTKAPITAHNKIIVETVNDKQESMLLLKYSGNIKLMTVANVGDNEEVSYTYNGFYGK